MDKVLCLAVGLIFLGGALPAHAASPNGSAKPSAALKKATKAEKAAAKAEAKAEKAEAKAEEKVEAAAEKADKVMEKVVEHIREAVVVPPQSTHYSLDIKFEQGELSAGQKGVAKIQIKPTGTYYISKEAPFRMSASAKNLKLDKEAFVRGDTKEIEGGPQYEIAFTAGSAGEAALVSDLFFYVCTPKSCDPQKPKVTIPYLVK